MGEIAECAARRRGPGLHCGATVNLRVSPEAREKRRQAARSPKAGATLRPPFCSSTGGSCKTSGASGRDAFAPLSDDAARR